MNIRQKQWQLKVLGYYEDNDRRGVDGKWGDRCVQGTKELQRDVGISVDGKFGRNTERKSIEKVKELQRSLGFTGKDVDGFGGWKTWNAKQEADVPVGPEPEPVDYWSTVKHFKRSEFACKCGGRYCNGFPVEPDRQLVRLLENIREHFGKPVRINSGIRCNQHNANVGGVKHSQHKLGTAADIVVAGVSPRTVYEYVNSIMPNTGGIGIYSWGVHVDVRKNKSRWNG